MLVLLVGTRNFKDFENMVGYKPVHIQSILPLLMYRRVQARCAVIFDNNTTIGRRQSDNGTGPGSGAVPCILHTCTFTLYTPADVDRVAPNLRHSRFHTHIRALNAASTAVWAERAGVAVVDAGALSLLPAVLNSMDSDKIHFGADSNPLYPLCWQVITYWKSL
jgi:hypothetical protein